MSDTVKIPLWSRILLGLLTLAILAFTIPAFMNPTSNPALANLTPENAVLGGVAGGFLARQLALALLGVWGVIKATATTAGMAGAGFLIWNLLEGLFILSAVGANPGAIAGLVFAAIGAVVLWSAISAK